MQAAAAEPQAAKPSPQSCAGRALRQSKHQSKRKQSGGRAMVNPLQQLPDGIRGRLPPGSSFRTPLSFVLPLVVLSSVAALLTNPRRRCRSTACRLWPAQGLWLHRVCGRARRRRRHPLPGPHQLWGAHHRGLHVQAVAQDAARHGRPRRAPGHRCATLRARWALPRRLACSTDVSVQRSNGGGLGAVVKTRRLAWRLAWGILTSAARGCCKGLL